MSVAIVLGVLVVAGGLCLALMRSRSRKAAASEIDDEIQKLNSVLARAERYKPENARSALKF